MKILILFGPPGVGKGTQAELLVQKLNYMHISTGQVLRDAISNRTPLGQKIEPIVKSGDLISDDMISQVMKEMLAGLKGVSGVLLDGFPRTVRQAELLDSMKDAIHSTEFQVINIDAPTDELVKRLIKRGAEKGRADDNAETIRNRLDVYHKQTLPVVAYYTKHLPKSQIHTINGLGTIEEVKSRIFVSLKV